MTHTLTARQTLGGFLSDRRRQMGRTRQELADHLGISVKTIKAIEEGLFNYGIDQLLKFCEALEIKPFFAPLEEINPAPEPSADAFLISVDAANKQLYILHRHFPACLVHVAGTTPAAFRVVDIYDNISQEELATHPFMDALKAFYLRISDAQNSKN